MTRGQGTVSVIADDPNLSQRQKSILLELYRMFRDASPGGYPDTEDDPGTPQNRSESPAEAASAEVQHIISRQTVRGMVLGQDQLGTF